MNIKTILCLALIPLLSACTINNIKIDGQSKSGTETSQTSPKPDSKSLRRQFENDIAKKLLSKVPANPINIVPTRQDLIKRHLNLEGISQALSRLDKSLLKSELKHAIHEVQMLEISLSRVLANWEQRNHLLDLENLLPPLSFTQHSSSEISKIEAAILDSVQGLETIRGNLSTNNHFVYSETLISESKNLCSKLMNPKNNPILMRYQQILLYSDMSTEKQRLQYQNLESEFKLNVIPAYQDFYKFLIGLESSITTNIVKREIGPHQRLELKQLHNALVPVDSAIKEILKSYPQSSLREIYEDHKQNLSSGEEQAILDQISQFVADLHYGLRLWFHDPIEREVLIAANDGLGAKPFFYQNNTAFFDLALLAKLPSFELETLTYQFSLPGMHILDYKSSFEKNPLWQNFASAWSLYVLSLPEAPVYYSHPLARIAALSRKQLAIHKAITDINLQFGHWTEEEARSYLMDKTPYPSEFIQNQLIMILATPDHAREVWFLSKEIKSLMDSNHGLSIKEFHKRILDLAPADIDFLQNEMPKVLQQR